MPYAHLHLILGALTVAVVLMVVYGTRARTSEMDWTDGVEWAAAVWVMWSAVALSQILFDVEVPLPAAWAAVGWAAVYSAITASLFFDYDRSGGLGHLAVEVVGIGAGLLVAAVVFGAAFLANRAA